MDQVNGTDTVQNRDRLARKIRNVFPGCKPEWQDGLDQGIAFRLVDEHGNYRSNLVQIRRISDDVFTRTFLERIVRWAKSPDDGQPRV